VTAPPSRIVLATTNRHKAREIAAILAPYGLAVEVPPRLAPVVEDGATFAENAYKKALSAARVAGRPALADDSGLAVAALGGAPGVHSARYAGPGATDEANTARLLAELAARDLVDPAAAFVCHAVLVSPAGEVLARAEARVEGVVRGPPRGANGFGYDPVFHYVGPAHPAPGLRFAELTSADKDALSHRGQAFRALAAALRPAPPDGRRDAPLFPDPSVQSAPNAPGTAEPAP
jgi:XTP/dITP diphosphohydrolase